MSQKIWSSSSWLAGEYTCCQAKDLSLIVGQLVHNSYFCSLFSTNLPTRPPMAAQGTFHPLRKHPLYLVVTLGASSLCLTHIKCVSRIKFYFQIHSQLIIPPTLSSARSPQSQIDYGHQDYCISCDCSCNNMGYQIARVILLTLKSKQFWEALLGSPLHSGNLH